MLKSILWKEWRESRLLLILGILLCCAFRLLPFLTDSVDTETVMGFMFFICGGIFSVLLGATGFSQEIEKETLPFIVSTPASRSIMWIAKIVSNLSLIGIFFVVAFLLSLGYLEYWEKFGLLGVFSISFLSYTFSFLISILINRPLTATIIGISGTIVMYFLIYILSALFLTSDLRVLPSKVIFVYFIIGLIFLFASFLLWRNYASRFKSVRKPVIITLVAIFLVGGMAYGGFYYFSIQKLKGVYRQMEISGDSLALEKVVSPPIPEEKNAAIIYQKAFDLLKITPDERKMELFDRKMRLSEELISPIRELVERNKKAIGYIKEASLYEKCRFPIEYEKGPALLLPHLSKMRDCGRLICVQASL